MPTMALSSASAAAAKAANIMLPNSSPYSITCGFKQSQNRSSTAPPPFPIGRPLRFGDFISDSQISLVHKCTTTTAAPTTNYSHLSTITAQVSVDYIPEASYYKVEAVLRPWRVPQVSSAMLKMGIRGVTVSDVRGFGVQGGLTERQAGSEFSEDKFVAKVKMEIVVSKNQVEAVIEKIIEEARTGEIGDGKIFVVPVADVIRVRTGERGEKAERMMGGRTDMFSAAESPAA
ncbi:nitrogen regulatory protein P-II homolog isoform X2 [Coffea arabica]|uniref:Nitrogen regulatory protein P-II homolog isoform X2 n=1 Tax=Coffea arabica TaxID=13443 RepID=A0A6P6VE11_COFAR|nr:nitrogen regulatory protein P-II homolog [Coffea arabica]